jgi:hypothetical protein
VEYIQLSKAVNTETCTGMPVSLAASSHQCLVKEAQS